MINSTMTSCALSTLSFQGSGQRQKRCEFWSVARPSFWKHAKHIAIKKQIANSTRKEWYDVKFYIFSHSVLMFCLVWPRACTHQHWQNCPSWALFIMITRMWSTAKATATNNNISNEDHHHHHNCNCNCIFKIMQESQKRSNRSATRA